MKKGLVLGVLFVILFASMAMAQSMSGRYMLTCTAKMANSHTGQFEAISLTRTVYLHDYEESLPYFEFYDEDDYVGGYAEGYSPAMVFAMYDDVTSTDWYGYAKITSKSAKATKVFVASYNDYKVGFGKCSMKRSQ